MTGIRQRLTDNADSEGAVAVAERAQRIRGREVDAIEAFWDDGPDIAVNTRPSKPQSTDPVRLGVVRSLVVL